MIRRRTLSAAFVALLVVTSGTASYGASDPMPGAELLVRFRTGTLEPVRAAVHAALGSTVIDRIAPLDVDVVRSVVGPKTYASDPNVLYAEPNVVGSLAAFSPPDDPDWSTATAWRLTRANAIPAWAIWPGRYYKASTRPARPVKVAVLDSWIDTLHPDFRNRGTTSTDARQGGQLDLRDAASFVPADQQRGTMDWHGTFVAGLIGAAANNRRGIAGVAYAAQVMPVTVADGNGVVDMAAAAAGITHAVDRGAKVINMSFTLPEGSQTLKTAVARAGKAGAVLVAAAGNGAGATTMYPAAYAKSYPFVLAVSATGPLDTIAPCSNHASYITVSAPGIDIMSLRAEGDTMTVSCGTSAATPLVAGAAALIAGRYPGIAPDAIRRRITRGADDIGDPGRDAFTGHGRLNIERALVTDGVPRTALNGPGVSGASDSASVRATARGRRIVAARYFVDRVGGARRGTLRPTDRSWGERVENVKAQVSLKGLSEGVHHLFVQAKDSKGRWGATAATALVVDRSRPEVTRLEVDPVLVVPGDRRTRVHFTILDALSTELKTRIRFIDRDGEVQASHVYRLPPGTFAAEWRGTVDRPGGGSYDGAALPPGPYTVQLTLTDEAGWVTVAETYCVVAPDTRT